MSYDNADLVNRNNVEGVSALGKKLGYKTGRGRGFFTATGGSAIGAHGTGLIIPKGASITRVVYKVLTTCASATSAGTLALSCVAANDIVSAAAISTNVWNAGIPVASIVVGGTLSTWLHTTADSEIVATVAVEAFTAGKVIVFADWIYWGDVALT